MKKFIVLIGNYGSGKTEIAINLAVQSASAGKNTLVIDLDKVNDYFRMSDRVDVLREDKLKPRDLLWIWRLRRLFHAQSPRGKR